MQTMRQCNGKENHTYMAITWGKLLKNKLKKYAKPIWGKV